MRKLSHDQKSIAYWHSKINKLNPVLVYQNRRVDYDDKDQALFDPTAHQNAHWYKSTMYGAVD